MNFIKMLKKNYGLKMTANVYRLNAVFKNEGFNS